MRVFFFVMPVFFCVILVIGCVVLVIVLLSRISKHKHHKRRLIQLPFLKLLSSRTLDDGEFYFKTDHSGYFEWATSMVSESTYWKIIDKEWPHKAKSYFSELLPKNQFFCARRL